MSKTIQGARDLFKKPDSGFTEGFQVTGTIHAPTIAIPISVELTKKEKDDIQNMLNNEALLVVPRSRVREDIEELTNITKQIKSIAAQSVLLHGERIFQAQELLLNYKEGVFTKWLLSTYGNRQTPYNMLRYYKFYQSASKEAQSAIETMPKKCIYLLAATEGDMGKKLEIVRDHGKTPQGRLLDLIKTEFPTKELKINKPINTSSIKAIEKACLTLENQDSYLSESDIKEIKFLIERMQSLCTAQS